MAERKPPAWENDPLSTFFAEAEHNVRVTALKFPVVYNLLRRINELFRQLGEAIERDNREERLVSRFLMVRTHSSFLAGIRLAMSGQISESFPVLRAAIEHAWYALHIAKDPNPSERAKIWLNRNESETQKSQCKSEFTVANVRRTHEEHDAKSAMQLYQIYENLIDLGAHPNQLGVMTSLRKTEIEKQINFGVGILYPEPLPVLLALKVAAEVAIGALKTFQLIFPERFTLLGIDLGIERLITETNTLFNAYVPKDKKPSTTS